MTGERDKDRPKAAAEQAAGWFARLRDEEATGDDWLAFEQWLAASRDHVAAYERLEELWVDLDDMAGGVMATLDTPVSLAAHRAARVRPGLSRRSWLAAGAGLAASVAIGVGVTNWATPTETYVTTAGQVRKVVLADGSRVWLNAGSRMEVRFARRARRVEMADGEAVFEVAHDPQRPFLIDTGDREVRVVGTAFNLRQRGDIFALTVRRGVVEVRPSGVPDARPARVTAGQRLIHTKGSGRSVQALANSDDAFAWTLGQLAYSDATLQDVADDLSRSLGTPVRVADTATGRIRFTGVLMLDDREAVLRHLEAFAPVRAERGPQGIVLRRR